MSRPLAKRRSLLEHQWLWLAGSLLTTLFSAALVVAIDGGWLSEYVYFPAIVRGYTLSGLLFGVFSVGLGLLTFLYTLRKRSLQEKMPVVTMAVGGSAEAIAGRGTGKLIGTRSADALAEAVVVALTRPEDSDEPRPDRQ